MTAYLDNGVADVVNFQASKSTSLPVRLLVGFDFYFLISHNSCENTIIFQMMKLRQGY